MFVAWHIYEAVQAERERCARLADAHAASGHDDEALTGLDCRMHVEGLAAAIRKAEA